MRAVIALRGCGGPLRRFFNAMGDAPVFIRSIRCGRHKCKKSIFWSLMED
jgi:hypothetical protein